MSTGFWRPVLSLPGVLHNYPQFIQQNLNVYSLQYKVCSSRVNYGLFRGEAESHVQGSLELILVLQLDKDRNFVLEN